MSDTTPRRAAVPPAGAATVATRPGRARPAWVTRTRKALRTAAGLGLAGALVYWLLPWIGRTTWTAIGAELRSLGVVSSLELLGLLLLGLLCYSFLLTGSLPGLGNRKALVLNLGGTAVSNVLPAGGVVGMAATYVMCRSWGFHRRDVSTSVIVTAVWNFLARMVLPILALAFLLTLARRLPASVVSASALGAVVGAVLVAAMAMVLVSEPGARTIATLAGRLLGPVMRRRGRSSDEATGLVLDLRDRTASVVHTGGWTMTAGLAGWFLCYFLLFWRALEVMGVHQPFAHVFAAFAVGRMLTALPITPGSVGVTEAGALAVLIAFGAPTAASTAAVVLFSVYTVLLVLPLGALAWFAWWVSPRTRTGPLLIAGPGGGP